MIISRNKKRLFKRMFWVFVPAVLVFATGILLLEWYAAHSLTRPPRTPLYGSPRDFQVILQKPMWFDETWKCLDGTESVGWLLSRGHTGPAIILSHSYGSNRSELLTLSFELWKAGYTILVYDLRGHGESKVEWSGLGTYEKDDLLSAIDYLKNAKTPDGSPLVDGRIGLYGVEMGGYVSLLAATQSPLVRVVAVDSVYPDVSYFINYRLKSFVGTGNMWARMVDAPVTNKLTNLYMHAYLVRREDSETAEDAAKISSDRQALFIVGKDSGPLADSTRELYNRYSGDKRLVEVNKSRLGRLYDQDSSDYDAQVVTYFKSALPLAAGGIEKGRVASR